MKSGFIFYKNNKNLMIRDYFVSKLCIGTATIWFTLWNCKSDWNCKNERNKKK